MIYISNFCWSMGYEKRRVPVKIMGAKHEPVQPYLIQPNMEQLPDRISYYNAFDEYHVKHNLSAMEKLFAEYVNKRLDSYLVMLDM